MALSALAWTSITTMTALAFETRSLAWGKTDDKLGTFYGTRGVISRLDLQHEPRTQGAALAIMTCLPFSGTTGPCRSPGTRGDHSRPGSWHSGLTDSQSA
jgi:hypothetical protein